MQGIGATALALLLACPVAAEVRYASFTSPSLGRDVRYAVDLPASYASGSRTYPVLYALHGLFESADFWERRGLADVLRGLREKGEVPDFLVVAVDGGNSFFVNGPEGRYQDLVTRDLITHVELTYRVVPGRDGRALLGVSMGGYAALRIAFERPELYRAVAAHSAMLLEKPPTRDEGAGRGQLAAFNQVFGDPIDPARWTAADPLAWASRVDPKSAPALYFDCGTEDRYGLFAGNEDLHRRLLGRGVAHTFALLPGNHGYEYVRSVLDRSLRFIADTFRAAPAPRAAITIHTATAPSLEVSYLDIPWGPNTSFGVIAAGVLHRLTLDVRTPFLGFFVGGRAPDSAPDQSTDAAPGFSGLHPGPPHGLHPWSRSGPDVSRGTSLPGPAAPPGTGTRSRRTA